MRKRIKKIRVGSKVKALPESNTWMHQYNVVGTVISFFKKEDKRFARIKVPKSFLERNHGKYILREWLQRGWSRPEDDFLFLDEGIEVAHLRLSRLPKKPKLTDEAKVKYLIDEAFGPEGKRLGVWSIPRPEDVIVTPGICVHEGCDKNRTHIALHNNHGTVEAFMVCFSHYKEWNGRCSDGFPLKGELLRKAA